MSNAGVLASVTALLKRTLENGLVEYGVPSQIGGDATISVLPPDRVTSGSEERAQLNVFLYHMTPHTAVRAASVRHGDDATGAALSLDLHYLITAYGSHDYQAEILLGHALQIINASQVLTPERIRGLLGAGKAAGGRMGTQLPTSMFAAVLEGELRAIKVVQQFPSVDEMLKLWSSLQAIGRQSPTGCPPSFSRCPIPMSHSWCETNQRHLVDAMAAVPQTSITPGHRITSRQVACIENASDPI
jgi:Pvc16 N-terminal domain